MKKMPLMFIMLLVFLTLIAPKVTVKSENLTLTYIEYPLTVVETTAKIIYDTQRGIKYLNLTNEYTIKSCPRGMVYDASRNLIFVCITPYVLEGNSGVGELNLTSGKFKFYMFPEYVADVFHKPCPCSITLDCYNNLWVFIDCYWYNPYVDYTLAKIDYENCKVKFYSMSNRAYYGQFHNGLLWFSAYDYLVAFNVSDDTIVGMYYDDYVYNRKAMGPIYCEGNYIWISLGSDYIRRFNILNCSFDVTISCLNNVPHYMDSYGDFLYAALLIGKKGETMKILKVNEVTFETELVDTGVTAEYDNSAVNTVMFDEYGNLWWGSTDRKVGVITCTEKISYPTLTTASVSMVNVPGIGVVFALKGSSYVGVKNVPEELRLSFETVDVNGDGLIDIYDLVPVALAYSSKPGDNNWNSRVDFNNDSVIDIYDLVCLALRYSRAIGDLS